MQAVTHLQQPTTQLQSIRLPRFLGPDRPCLAIVKHSSIEFLLLPGGDNDASDLLRRAAVVEVNARILRVAPCSGKSGEEALAVLTDHHRPRLLMLTAGQTTKSDKPGPAAFEVTCTGSVLLDEMARPPAELGLGVWAATGGDKEAVMAHTHSGILKILFTSSSDGQPIKGEWGARVFAARLVHPTLISLAPLQVPSGSSNPVVALLSISSVPSRLPGLGTQCLPVLSYHEINESKQDLSPIPWGPSRKVPQVEQAGRRASRAGEEPEAPSTSSKAGPQAMGRTLAPEQVKQREQNLAKSAMARAHVPLPFADALGAHHITALPTAAGGGVIVWSETSILIVPPPPSFSGDVGSDEAAASSSALGGKRRKSSGAAAAGRRASQASTKSPIAEAPPPLSRSPEQALLAQSPSHHANEHGKRRRSSTKGALGPDAEATARLSLETSSTTTTATPRNPKILRLSLPRPIQVTSASIFTEDTEDANGGVILNAEGSKGSLGVFFGTSAGALNHLEISLVRSSEGDWTPKSMRVSRVGKTARLSGTQSLTYLGEGYIHGASASGDSAVFQLVSKQANGQAAAPEPGSQDAEMVSPPTSPVQVRGRRKSSSITGISTALAHSQKLQQDSGPPDIPDSSLFTIQTVLNFQSLAPILDFVIDGDPNGPLGGTQARIVSACGTGPDGAIGIVKNGVAMDEVLALALENVRKIWTVSLGQGRVGLVCGYAQQTSILSVSDQGLEDVTASFGGDLRGRTLEAADLASGGFAVVSEKSVQIASSDAAPITWSPSVVRSGASITAASIDTASGQILVALTEGHVVLLAWDASAGALKQIATTSVTGEVSALHLAHNLAAVGLWTSETVRLFSAPTLEDLTPSSLEDSAGKLGAVPRSILIHAFKTTSDVAGPLHLLIALTNGALTSYTLSLPTADSFSKTIGVFDRKTSALGRQPLQLSAFKTAGGKEAVLATNGEAPSVLWSENRRMTFSSLSYGAVLDAAQVTLPGSQPMLALALPDCVQILTIREIGQLDVAKVHLGLDNPVAVAGVSADERGVFKYFAVVTNPYRPEGNATREKRQAKVIVLDSIDLERVAEFELDDNERASCVAAIDLDGVEHLVVGTGFTNPYESETTAGRLVGFRVDTQSGGLTQSFERQVDGNTYSIASISGKLVAAVNSEVMTFALDDRADSNAMVDDVGHLKRLSRWGCAFVACTLSPISADSQRVIVGDALRSMSLLHVHPSTGRLTEIARDCDPFWTTACAPLDFASQTFIGADVSFNLFTCQRAPLSAETKRRIEREAERRRERVARGDSAANAASDNNVPLPHIDEDAKWSHIMERRGGWHYGDLINRFREGAIVSKAACALTSTSTATAATATTTTTSSAPASAEAGSQSVPRIDPRLVFCTSSGAIGIISTLCPTTSQILSSLERNLAYHLYNSPEAGQKNDVDIDFDFDVSADGNAATTTAPQHHHLHVGAIDHSDWRTLRTDHRTSASTGFLDGDLVQRFLSSSSSPSSSSVYGGRELTVQQRQQVLDGPQGEYARIPEAREVVEDLVEALTRVC